MCVSVLLTLTYCCFACIQVDNSKTEMNPDDLAKGATFLDVITASNVAYAMSLIKNGRLLVWIDQLRRGKAKHNGDDTDAINEMMIADEEEQEKEDEDEDEDEEGGVKKTKKKTKTKTKKL